MTEIVTEQKLGKLIELQTETVKLLAMSLARDVETQAQLVVEMSERGFSSSRIADILAVKPDSVRKAISRAKKAKVG